MTKITKQQMVLKCPHCGKLNTLVKHGFRHKAGSPKKQQWICNGELCSRTTCEPIKVFISKENLSKSGLIGENNDGK